MKELRRNMRLVLAVLLAGFVVTAAYATYSVYFYGGRWFSNPYNPRLRAVKQQVTPGDILDRTGVVLAATEDGERTYPAGSTVRKAASHVLGDTKAVVSAGAETFLAGHLLGFNASIFDRVTQLFTGDERHGNDVTLTISSKLQKYAHDAFPSGNNGAAVVINYKTGEIYLMYSKPEFDPKHMERALEGDSDDSSLINRVSQGRYTPGSVFKVITAAALLDRFTNMQERVFTCEGVIDGAERPVTCSTAHGELTFQRAFEVSCNCAFASWAKEIGDAGLRGMAQRMGFGQDTLYQDLIAYDSRFPAQTQRGDDLGWTAVGQGTTLVTPLHMALIAAGIANDGEMPEPKLILQVTTPSGRLTHSLRPSVEKRILDSASADTLKQLMRGVVKSGTGTRAAVKGYNVCGKTGTAQVSDSGNKKSHSWFMGFIDDPEMPLAIAVIVEHGGSGGEVAAPLASKLLKYAADNIKP